MGDWTVRKRMSKSLSRWTDFMTRLGGGGMDDDGGWKRGGQKFLAGLKAVPFSVFHPVLNYRAGRLRLPRGTILIRKLAESLRSIGTIRWRRGGAWFEGARWKYRRR